MNLVDSVSVLDKVVGVVEEIEGLRLKLKLLAFADFEIARQANVDSLQPRAVQGIQADAGRGTCAIDAAGGSCGVLVEGGVVEIVIGVFAGMAVEVVHAVPNKPA